VQAADKGGEVKERTGHGGGEGRIGENGAGR